jgi:hypothetical protein
VFEEVFDLSLQFGIPMAGAVNELCACRAVGDFYCIQKNFVAGVVPRASRA